MFHLLTLPFRIVFGLFFALLALPFALLALPFAILFLPFLLLRFMIKAAVAVIMLPILLFVAVIVGGALLFGVAMAILVPLAPFLLIASLVWAFTRNSRAAIAVRG